MYRHVRISGLRIQNLLSGAHIKVATLKQSGERPSNPQQKRRCEAVVARATSQCGLFWDCRPLPGLDLSR